MDQRTYELIVQYITDRSGVRVELDHNCRVPSANVESKVITLPANISDDNVFAGLAITMHEAAHIQHTLFDPNQLTGGNQDKFCILNAIEDIRIDRKNFTLMPNIKEFYRCLMKKHIGARTDADWAMAPFHMRVLAVLICTMEGFRSEIKIDKSIKDFVTYHGIEGKAEQVASALDTLETYTKRGGYNLSPYYQAARLELDDLHKLLFSAPPPQQSSGQGQGDDEEDEDDQGQAGQQGDTEGAGDPKQKQSQAPPQQQTQQQQGQSKPQQGHQPLGHEGAMGLLRRGSKEVFRPCKTQSKGRGSSFLGEVTLEETTKNQMKELLNERCVVEITDGNVLDTGNLQSFFTGNIEELFTEKKNITRKKSKIVVMLDASGSMGEGLDFSATRTNRNNVVVKNANAIKHIIDDVCQTEGLNVGYEVFAFSNDTWKVDKNNIASDYFKSGYYGGGTNITAAVKKAEQTLVDPEVEGERLLILLTDGEVSESEIKYIKDRITYSNSHIKALIVGVGADVSGYFVKHVIGNNNIIAEKHSNIVLLEAICQLLGG